jgi:hypothetical protein
MTVRALGLLAAALKRPFDTYIMFYRGTSHKHVSPRCASAPWQHFSRKTRPPRKRTDLIRVLPC